MLSHLELLGLSDAGLGKVDPVEMNLLVAKSIPALAGLEIASYQRIVDEMAEGVRGRLPYAEQVFRRNPAYW